MSSSSHLLKRAVVLWKSGQEVQARRIFECIIYNDRCNEAAWIWYIYSLGENKAKIAALENFLCIFPDHTIGKKALENLRAEEAHHAVVEANDDAPFQKRVSEGEIKPLPAQKAPLVEESKASLVRWVFVVLGLCFLLYGAATFTFRYGALQAEHETLEASHQLLSRNYDQLSAEHQLVQSQYQALQDAYQIRLNDLQALQNDYQATRNDLQALQNSHAALEAEHKSLQDSYTVLLDDYNNSVRSYTKLRDIAIVPPYIYISGREVHLSFLTPDQETYNWSVPFSALENDLKRGNAERNRILSDPSYPRLKLSNTITGETYRIIDYRRFVDPSSFSGFSRYFYEQAPTEEAFIQEIWYIVAQLTAYSYEITDTPRYPLETLLAGGGDCEDHAILFASMILAAAPSDWKVELVYMDGYNPDAPRTLNHVIVYINTGSHQYTVEATQKEIMEPYSQAVNGWYSEIEN